MFLNVDRLASFPKDLEGKEPWLGQLWFLAHGLL